MSELPSFISKSVIRGRYMLSDLIPTATAGAHAVACAGWEECTPGYEMRRETFRYHAIEYIAGGAWELETARGKWSLGPGSVFAYGPGSAYSLRALAGASLSKYFVDFSRTLVANDLRKAGLKPGGAPCVLTQRRWVQDLMDQLIETSDHRASRRRMLSEMIADLLIERIRADLATTRRVSQSRLKYEQCRQFLAEEYPALATLGDAARRCGVSAVYLSRLFHRYDTESPYAFVTRLKMNHAAERIARGNLPVKSAAAEVGFEDPYHFSRVFKKVHGIPPSRFGVRAEA